MKHKYDYFFWNLEYVNKLKNKQSSIKLFNSLYNFPFS